MTSGRDVGIESAVRIVQFYHLSLDQQAPSAGHGVPSVQAQVHKHLFELCRIGFDRIDRGGDDFELDVPADYFVQEADQPAGDGIDVHGLRLQHLTPREGQELARKRGGSFSLFADPGKALGTLVVRSILIQTKFSPSQNRAHHIVEIMRDPSRKLSNGFKFLRLAQLPFHGAQFGYVFGDDFERTGMIGYRKHADVESYAHDAAITPPPFAFGALYRSMFSAGIH